MDNDASLRTCCCVNPILVSALICTMDPKTVVIMLAINLIFSGLLYHLIARRVRAESGLNHLSLGGILFGIAYMGRLFLADSSGNSIAPVADVLMFVGTLLYLSGVGQMLGRPGLTLVWLVGLAIGYGAVQMVVAVVWGSQGRFALLNAFLALAYGGITVSCLKWYRAQPLNLHVPFILLALLMGGLSALTVSRGIDVVMLGEQSSRQGLATQIYFAYATLSVVSMAVLLLWIVFEQLNGRLQEMTTHDPLTGVLNRRGLDNALIQHFANRDSRAMTLLEVDIDHFKRVNDELGHAMGDLVLQAVALALAGHVRGNDFVARVGGEEFLVGCVGDDPTMAEHLGERLRACVTQLQPPVVLPDAFVRVGKLPSRRSLPRCTVSVGISNPFTELDERDRANREADAALYAAKAAGRNRVVKFDAARHAPHRVADLQGTSPAPLSAPMSLPQPLR